MKKKLTIGEFEIIMKGEITKSKRTLRPKYFKCLICDETRYIERHHLRQSKTVPLCPIHHRAIHIGDVKIKEKNEN